MAYVEVDDIRKYLNLPFCEDNLLLMELEESAEQVLAGHLNVESMSVYEDENGDIPQALKTAIKTLVATWYSNREAVSYGQPFQVPYTLLYMLQPYKKYVKNIEE
jgi:uncharacterized phiE125 gp8 family phage protein